MRSAQVVLAIALVAVLPALHRDPAAATGPSFTMSTFGEIAVEPASGRVYVSGDDRVLAFSPGGALLATIPNLPGARGLTFAAGSLWVAQTTADSIAQIDLQTNAKVADHPTGPLAESSIATVGGRIYFGAPAAAVGGPSLTLRALDPATGSIATRGVVEQGKLYAVPGQPDRLLMSRYPEYSVVLRLYDVSAEPMVELAVGGSLGSSIAAIAPTELGTAVVAARSLPRFDEMSLVPDGQDLHATGVGYRADSMPNGIAYSPARGGVFVGTTSPAIGAGLLWVYRRGVPVVAMQQPLDGGTVDGGVVIGLDADRAHVVLKGSGSTHRLVTVPLGVSIEAGRTPVVVAGTARSLTFTGSGLGATTGASLEGEPVDWAIVDHERLAVDIRTNRPPGPATLSIETPWGILTREVVVEAGTTGTVRGRVQADGRRAPGATVTVVAPGGFEATTTTGEDGTYEIAQVPATVHVDIRVSTGASVHTFTDRTLTGSGPWRFDVDLDRPPASSLEQRRLALPPGPVRRVAHDPSTGRTFVAVGDAIVVADADGRFVEQIEGMWTVHDLQVVDDRLFAMLRWAGTVVALDTSSLEVVDTWPVRRTSTGSLAVVGDLLRFVAGDYGPAPLGAIDLRTGAVTSGGLARHSANVVAVGGSSDTIVSWEADISSVLLTRWTGSTPMPEKAAETPRGVFPFVLDLVADAEADRAWTANGRELLLSTMRLSGTSYAAGSTNLAAAHAPALGGVLAFGRSVYRSGDPTRTHLLPTAPSSRALALSADGMRTYAGMDGSLVVSSLAPVVNEVSPNPAPTKPSTITVTGAGLGGATKVSVGSRSVPFSVGAHDRLTVSLPTLPSGDHRLTVTTPWGTSSARWLGVGVSGPWAPASSWPAFVDRQHVDLTGAAPAASFRQSWSASLASGAATKGELVSTLRRSSDNVDRVDPAARLYRAFLGRTPDAGGLGYWVQRRRTGSWTLVRIADHFARSSEFTRRYGALTDRQFVQRIYTDVLGRAADPAGVDFWARQLEQRRRTRGAVMVGFSESGEYRRAQAEATDAAVITIFLLDRAPTNAEVTQWVQRQRQGTPVAVLAQEILDSSAYRAKVAG